MRRCLETESNHHHARHAITCIAARQKNRGDTSESLDAAASNEFILFMQKTFFAARSRSKGARFSTESTHVFQEVAQT